MPPTRSLPLDLDTMVADIGRLVSVESPSGDLRAVRRSAEAVSALIGERLNAIPETVVLEGVAHLRLRLGTGPRRIVILAHHDTVWPIGTLERLPFASRAGRLTGPGCFDMKTGIVMGIHALAQIQAVDPASLDGVTLLITGDEEVGSPTSRALIEQEAAGCRVALVLEAAGEQGALKTERKGVSNYRLIVTGLASHAGLEPEKGVNAAVELAHQIVRLGEISDPAAGTTVTPTKASAGDSGNTVPAHASVLVDVRARTVEEQLRVDAGIRSLDPLLPGASLEIEGGPNRPPMEHSNAAELFDRARVLFERLGFGALRQASVGGASDGNFTAGIGVPTLDGLGAVGGGAHADGEHVLVDEIPKRTALLAALILDVNGTDR